MEFAKKEKKQETLTPEEIETRLSNWPESYYLERDAQLRKKLLDAADERGLTPEENKIRRKLYDLRYRNKDSQVTDRFLAAWIDMRFLVDGNHGLFGFNFNPKKVRKVLDPIGFEELSDKGADMTGEEILYRSVFYEELHHLGLLYIALCQEDKGYNAVLFGFGTISEETQAKKVAREVKNVGIDVIRNYNPGDKYGLWTRAMTTAYAEMYPNYTDFLEED